MKLKNVDFIRESEQLRLKAYKPTKNDVWTIGYGHTKDVVPGMTITEAQAEQLLYEDLLWVEDTIKRNVKVPLNQNQYDALGSWVFNLGEGNLKASTLLKKLNAKDYIGAANEFLKWNKQTNKQTGKKEILNGLTTRRMKEKELFLTPVPRSTMPEAIGAAITAGGVGAAIPLAAQDIGWPVIALVGAVIAIISFIIITKLKKKSGIEMAKIGTLTDVGVIATAGPTINNNWDVITAAFQNTVSRDGSSPNTMSADFDLNSNDLLNGGVGNFTDVVVAGNSVSASVAAAAASAVAASNSEIAAAASAVEAANSVPARFTSTPVTGVVNGDKITFIHGLGAVPSKIWAMASFTGGLAGHTWIMPSAIQFSPSLVGSAMSATATHVHLYLGPLGQGPFSQPGSVSSLIADAANGTFTLYAEL